MVLFQEPSVWLSFSFTSSQSAVHSVFTLHRDFFLTVVLALISFKEPWDGLVVSFKELANGTIQVPEIHDSIYEILETYLDDLAGNIEIHIFKQGMNIRVKVNLHNVQHEIVRKLLEDKQQMLYLLKKKHEYISVEYAL